MNEILHSSSQSYVVVHILFFYENWTFICFEWKLSFFFVWKSQILRIQFCDQQFKNTIEPTWLKVYTAVNYHIKQPCVCWGDGGHKFLSQKPILVSYLLYIYPRTLIYRNLT